MRKTYNIIGTYRRETETVEEAIETRQEADYLLGEYQLAFGPSWHLRIKIHREYGVGNDRG